MSRKTTLADILPTLRPQPAPIKSSGKRASPDYVQISACIRRDTRAAVKRILLVAYDGKEISELLEELLAAWVAQAEPKGARFWP